MIPPRDPHRIEELSVEAEAIDAAWAAVGARRRARARRASAAAALALAAFVLAAVVPSLADRSEDAPVRVASRDRSGESSAPPPEGKVDMATPEMGGGPGTPSGDRRPGARARAENREGVVAEGPVRPGAPGARPKPPVERESGGTIFVGCISRFCVAARARADNDRHILQMDLCVPVGGRQWRFSYATAQEVDFVVATEEGDPVWTWSAGQRFAASEHHLDVSPGECVVWATHWDRADEQGRPADPGRYRLTVKTLAEQANDSEASASTTFNIS